MARRPDKRKARPGGARPPVTIKRRNASAPVGGLQAAPELADKLKPEIKARFLLQAEQIRRSAHRAADEIILIGSTLIDVKRAIPHGQWLPWLKAEFGWSEPTAQRFMRVAQAFESVTLTDLESLQIDASALYLLAGRGVPDSARQQAIEAAREGTRLSLEAAKRIVFTETRVPGEMPVVNLTMGPPTAPAAGVTSLSSVPRRTITVDVQDASIPGQTLTLEVGDASIPGQTLTLEEEETIHIPFPVYRRPVEPIENLADLLAQVGEIIDAVPDLDVPVLGEKERIDARQKISRAVGALQALRERIDAPEDPT